MRRTWVAQRMESTKSCTPTALIVRASRFHPTKSSEDDCWLGKVHIVQVGAQAVTSMRSTASSVSVQLGFKT